MTETLPVPQRHAQAVLSPEAAHRPDPWPEALPSNLHGSGWTNAKQERPCPTGQQGPGERAHTVQRLPACESAAPAVPEEVPGPAAAARTGRPVGPTQGPAGSPGGGRASRWRSGKRRSPLHPEGP